MYQIVACRLTRTWPSSRRRKLGVVRVLRIEIPPRGTLSCRQQSDRKRRTADEDPMWDRADGRNDGLPPPPTAVRVIPVHLYVHMYR
jgi:hypothetical protein